ncbi:MAG: response regulator, partial [Nitrospira sp.]|nr:response regulator [Nitrospira sp.]
GRRGDAKIAREAGLAAYLTKPIRERQLHDCLVAVMTQRPDSSRAPAERPALPLITRHTLAETEAQVDLRVLLAEDNIVNQKVAVRLFQRLGYRIDVVANGREVLEALSRIHYDVVFMDCQMPEMDGFEATHLIRERAQWDRVPIIAMTANAMQGDRERCLAAGMDDYVSKPISMDALASVLDRVNREHTRVQSKKGQEAA